MSAISRREIIAASGAALVLPSSAIAAPLRKRKLRIAHLTDFHVQPEQGAPKGMEMALEHAQSHRDKPQLMITGGDLIMDAWGIDKDRVAKQWDIYNNLIKENVEIPIAQTIGNHDVWGYGNPSKFSSESLYGKKWFCEAVGQEKPYRSFDKNGWHIVLLDSVFHKDNGYIAKLDEEQFAWLENDLANTPAKTPVLVVTHIPILGVCSLFDGDNEKSGSWVMPGSYIHIDARRLVDLFLKHPNVKLCLSGHEHQLDEVVYNGVTYICNGAVCAGWWGGDYFQCTYGYALVDLYDDGTFENKYVPYGWKTVS